MGQSWCNPARWLALARRGNQAIETPRVTAKLYIRPVAGLPRGLAGVPALRLSGRDDLRFTAAEIIERDGSQTRRGVKTAAELAALSAPLAHVLDRIEQQRTPIAGVALDRPRIMGVVNVTPDSFSDGGRWLDPEAAVAHGLQLEAEGADILDIGGESTRPGAEPIGVNEELRRVIPVIAALARQVRVPISIDTRNAEVMRRAADAGARVINDVAALGYDPKALHVAAEAGLPVVLMHAQGDPRTMQLDPRYDDVVLDVYDWLEARIANCGAAGIGRERVIVDPGIGFGKTLDHNLALLASLSVFHGLGCPILLGASRKSFISRLCGGAPASERLPGSLAAALTGAAQGVQIVRVHDVAATRQALMVWGEAQM
ncbi:MAG: dihydropteroate synthase [Hyphomicrobiaceae bacterium]|nr:dihydropteroate synthase [Hyphomicrobiaceae bacterium]